MIVVSRANISYGETHRGKGGFALHLSHKVICRLLLSEEVHKNASEPPNMLQNWFQLPALLWELVDAGLTVPQGMSTAVCSYGNKSSKRIRSFEK